MQILSSTFWVKSIFYALVLTLLFAGLLTLKILLFPLTVGFLLAFILEPLISKLESKNFSRLTAIAILYSVLFLLMALFWVWLTPRMIQEFQEFNTNSEHYKEFLISKYNELKLFTESLIPNQIPWTHLEEKATTLSTHQGGELAPKLLKALLGSTEAIFSFIIVSPLFGFFLLKDGAYFKKWVIQFVPNRFFELSTEILHNINQQTGAFIRGQILDSLLNSMIVSFLLYLIGLPYWLLIGCFAGIANAIPFVGPITAGSIGVVVALASGAPNPLLVVAVFVGVHLIDVMLIYPKTVGHSLNLHELVVILGIILGGHLGGVIGMLAIIPILGILIRSTQVMYRLLKGYHIL